MHHLAHDTTVCEQFEFDLTHFMLNKIGHKRIQTEGERDLKALKKLKRQRFACETDARKALEQFQKEPKVTTLGEHAIEAAPRYSGKGRPKKGEAPAGIDYTISATLTTPLATKEERQKRDGLFILSTNQRELSASTVLKKYKSQQRVERGF